MQVTLNRTIYLIELCKILRIVISKRSEKSVCNITKRFLVVTNLQFKRAEQSIVFAGHVAPPKSDPDDIAIETMNNILGGTFTSRINMNLREDKHWSYGSRSLIVGARGQRRPLLSTRLYKPIRPRSRW